MKTKLREWGTEGNTERETSIEKKGREQLIKKP